MTDLPDDDRPRRENDRPLDELISLVVDVLGSAAPDRIVTWLGVSKRNADRWLSGDSTFPPRVVSELDRLAPLVVELDAALRDLVADFRDAAEAEAIPENLIRLRLREYSKRLSDEPPPKPGPRRD